MIAKRVGYLDRRHALVELLAAPGRGRGHELLVQYIAHDAQRLERLGIVRRGEVDHAFPFVGGGAVLSADVPDCTTKGPYVVRSSTPAGAVGGSRVGGMADDKRDAMLKTRVRREFLERVRVVAKAREQDVSEWLRQVAFDAVNRDEDEDDVAAIAALEEVNA